jgi:hypothetical protein
MSAVAEMIQLPCPGCRKPYEWSPEHVGKLARCSCGHIIRIPDISRPPDAAGRLPALAAGRPRFSASAASAAADDEVEDGSLADLGAGYGEEEQGTPNRFRDRDLPLALLALAGLLVLAQVAHLSSGSGLVAGAVLLFVVVQIVVNVGLMLLGVLAASKLAEINFGPAAPAILKLCALFIAPSTLGSIVEALLGGDVGAGIIGSGLTIVLYWGLMSYLFRLSLGQTLICVVTISAVNLLAAMCVLGAIMGSGPGF